MRKYAAGELGEQPIPFKDADRIVAIGSDGMMNAVRLARHGVLTRPVGNVIVLMPPYCTMPGQVQKMVRAVFDSIREVFGRTGV